MLMWADDHTLQFLTRRGSKDGRREAVYLKLRHGAERWSAADLEDTIARLAAGLLLRGTGRGDVVALWGADSPAWIVVALAVLRTGATLMPVDSEMAEDTARHVLSDGAPSLIFSGAAVERRLGGVIAGTGAELRLLDGGEEDTDRGWRALLAEPKEDPPGIGTEDTAVLFYTSGTTGPPKGVPLSHANLSYQLTQLAEAGVVSSEDRLLLPLPLHHVYPFVVGMLSAIALGVPIVLPGGFSGPRLVGAAKEGRATVMIGVPRLYEMMTESLRRRLEERKWPLGPLSRAVLRFCIWCRRRTGIPAGDLLLRPLRARVAPDLRVAVSGGAPLEPSLAWMLEGLGWRVATGYGLTETSPMVTISPPGTRRFETVGWPLQGTEIRVDPSAAAEGAAEGTGEVLVRGPGIFKEYRNLPDKTRDSFEGGGWFRTGDLGRVGRDGSLSLSGRSSTRIVTAGGETVQPDEIESTYEGHPWIAEAAVLEKEGQMVGIVVPSAAGARAGDRGDAMRRAVAEAGERLPSTRRLAQFSVSAQSLPRTRLGKPQRHRLPELYEEVRSGRAGREKAHPLDEAEMDPVDRELLEQPGARPVWRFLAERFAKRRLAPDSDLQIDLGIDSTEWLSVSLELSEQGIELPERAYGEVRTVRDLMRAASQPGEAGQEPVDWTDPRSALTPDQRRWLSPLGPFGHMASLAGHACVRAVMRSWFSLRCEGLENLPERGPFVLAPNHASLLDPLAVGACLDRQWLARTRWAGFTGIVFSTRSRRLLARLARAVPIDPRSGVSAGLALGASTLEGGKVLVWFPEGRRSEGGGLQEFKPGLGMLLERRPAPVVPVAIIGSYEAWPVGRRWPRRTAIRVSFHPAVQAHDLAKEGEGRDSPRRISRALHARMEEILNRGA